MKWTSEKPTKPGWYWYKSLRRPTQVMQVYANEFFVRGVLFAQSSGLNSTRVAKLTGQWAGPLEEPQE